MKILNISRIQQWLNRTLLAIVEQYALRKTSNWSTRYFGEWRIDGFFFKSYWNTGSLAIVGSKGLIESVFSVRWILFSKVFGRNPELISQRLAPRHTSEVGWDGKFNKIDFTFKNTGVQSVLAEACTWSPGRLGYQNQRMTLVGNV